MDSARRCNSRATAGLVWPSRQQIEPAGVRPPAGTSDGRAECADCDLRKPHGRVVCSDEARRIPAPPRIPATPPTTVASMQVLIRRRPPWPTEGSPSCSQIPRGMRGRVRRKRAPETRERTRPCQPPRRHRVPNQCRWVRSQKGCTTSAPRDPERRHGATARDYLVTRNDFRTELSMGSLDDQVGRLACS
jgi:hypothetical protein